MRSRRNRWISWLIAGAALILLPLGPLATPARAAADSVTVDMSVNNGAPDYKASGFLYGLSADGTQPADPTLSALKPKMFRGGAVDIGCGWVACGLSGFNVRWASVEAQAQRAASLGATYNILLSDMWNDNNVDYPGDNGDWAPWTAFLTQLVQGKIASGLTNVRYDIWNEPDGSYFWPRSVSQYEQMWITAVQTIRSLDPNAVISGPGYSNFNSSELSSWLDFAKANNVVPDVLDWHFGDDPVTDVATARSLLASKGITVSVITIGEALRQDTGQTMPGYTAYWIGRVQKSGASGTDHAIWDWCCSYPYLDGLLTTTGAETGAYYVYQDYADITGQLVGVDGSASIDGVVGTDASTGSARILLGNNGGVTGDVDVNVTNLNDAGYLINSGLVHVEVAQDDNTANPPVVVQSFNATVTGNAIAVTIPWANVNDAYSIVLTPYSPSAGTTEVTANNDGSGVFYSGTWSTSTNRGFGDLNDDVAYTTTNGDYAEFAFDGTGVELTGELDPEQGNVAISIDGSPPVTVSTVAPTREMRQVIYTSPPLTEGTHWMTVTKLDGTYMTIDGFTVTQPAGAPNTVNSDGPGIVNTGTSWADSTNRGFGDFDDDVTYTTNNGDYTTFTFVGTGVTLVGEVDPEQGDIYVTVDGGPPVTVDTSSATRLVQQAIYTSPTLSSGVHTIRVVKVSGTYMVIDAFIVHP